MVLITEEIGSNDFSNSGSTSDTTNYKLGTGSRSFDGSNDYIATTYHLSRPTGSVNFWIRPAFALEDNGYHTLISDADFSTNNRRISFAKKTDNTYWFEIYNDSGSNTVLIKVDDDYAPQNTWTMITLTWTTNNVKVYFNATLRGSDTSATMPTANPSSSVRWGLWQNNALPWDGNIDDIGNLMVI